MSACQIIVNNIALNFEVKSLSVRVALKLIRALNAAYMQSKSISCLPYQPTEQTDRARFITACQLVHDNLFDITEGQKIRNECIEKLKA